MFVFVSICHGGQGFQTVRREWEPETKIPSEVKGIGAWLSSKDKVG